MKWKFQSLFNNAAEKSIIIIKFEVDNNTVVILYKKQQKSWHIKRLFSTLACNNVTKTVYLSFDWFEASSMLLFS